MRCWVDFRQGCPPAGWVLGEWIYSTYPNGRIPQIYGYTSGTSTAAAHVTGVAALVKSGSSHLRV